MNTKKITLNGLMIAAVFLVTYFTKIPGPVGPFNVGDAAIMITAAILGRNSGFVAGAFGSAVADIAMGYGIFAPITFIVKGLEGYVVGMVAHSEAGARKSEIIRIIGVAVGAVIMILGYFIAEATVLRLVDPSFGYVKAIQDLPFNLVQGGVSMVLGYLLIALLERVNIRRYVV